MGSKLLPISPGTRFGRLRVLSTASPGISGDQRVSRSRCRCICGVLVTVRNSALKRGSTSSCGCLNRERRLQAVLKHGCTKGGKVTPEYSAWTHMLHRCYNKAAQGYHNYGGRGIRVCPSWRSSFKNFLKDVGHRPSRRHSLDRINNDLGYRPGNIRWATRAQQSMNTRRVTYLTHAGRRLPISEWAALFGVGKMLIVNRLRRGWTVSKALTLGPSRGLRPSKTLCRLET